MADTYHCRPSELLGLQGDPVTAFYVDRALFAFGTTIDSELEKAAEKGKTDASRAMKQQMVLNRWLRAEGGGRFRDPAAK